MSGAVAMAITKASELRREIFERHASHFQDTQAKRYGIRTLELAIQLARYELSDRHPETATAILKNWIATEYPKRYPTAGKHFNIRHQWPFRLVAKEFILWWFADKAERWALIERWREDVA